MIDYEKRTNPRAWQQILGSAGIVGGLWLILAPFLLNYGGTTIVDVTTKKPVSVDLTAVTASDIICGVLLIALIGFTMWAAGKVEMIRLRYYTGIAIMVLGIYLIAAPYLFDLLKVASYMGLDKPNTNDQLVGILTVVLGGFAFQSTFLSNEIKLIPEAKIIPPVQPLSRVKNQLSN